jgi:DNA-binding transcriptional LysR family regulator
LKHLEQIRRAMQTTDVGGENAILSVLHVRNSTSGWQPTMLGAPHGTVHEPRIVIVVIAGYRWRVDMQQLRYFSEVAAAGTYHGASERLHLTEPGVWKQVRLLERELGIALFEREGRRVHLTRAGALLLERTDQALASVDRIQQLANELRRGNAGTVTIGCGPGHVSRFIGPILQRFRKTHPDVQVDIWEYPRQGLWCRDHPASPVDDLAQGRLDLLTIPRRVDELAGFVVFEGRLVAVLPEEGHDRTEKTIPIQALCGPTLLVPESGDAVRLLLERACHVAGFEPVVKAAARSPSTLIALGRAGAGVPVLLDYMLEHSGPAIGSPIADASGVVKTPIWLYWRKDTRLLPATEAFIDEARAATDNET